MEVLVTLAPAALAFLIGVRVGPKGARIGLGVCLGATLGFTLLSRYVYAMPEREWQTVAWLATAASALLICSIALIGPSIFKRWLHALALSVGVFTLVRLTVSREMLVSFLIGSPPT